MVFYKGEINSNVLEDYIIKAEGDDTLLLVKCENENNSFVFYKVNHNKGKDPIKVASISFEEYSKLERVLETKYHFYDYSK